ncbi:type II toxin-antitoxin system YafQ family toxin [Candidatus Saccharibacteria bacterium]|nr:type II toxin-antitoxin system YafQ family toxin [Candidatus Saccharibacteria bacterium]MBQ6149640.1 type II toxin-antitoxin system YafQ family toxin [Candidatus Saccharibacteria bacterium]
MKYHLEYTTKFKKNYKKMMKRGLKREDLQFVIEKIRNGEKLDKKYKDHILKGKFKGYHECHIHPDWLLVYKIQDDILVLTLVDTGSHADLFDM